MDIAKSSHARWGTMMSSLVFSSDETKLASESGTTIKIWDIASGQVLRTLTGKNAASGVEGLGGLEGWNDLVTSVAFSPHGDILAAGYLKDE